MPATIERTTTPTSSIASVKIGDVEPDDDPLPLLVPVDPPAEAVTGVAVAERGVVTGPP